MTTPILHGPGVPGTRPALWLLGAAGLFVVAHAFVPLEEFIHRGDDAYYYLKTAYNYPATGFWSFDTIHSTNGVQPLWAWLTTAVAQIMAWAGMRDADLFARTMVGITGLFHVGASLLLLRLLARQVSLGAGIAVAAALLLPLGIVWRHVWGMENSLYAFCLVSALSYYLFSFRRAESDGRAAVLGLLFGLTALARLNAVLLAVAAVIAIAVDTGSPTRSRRVRYAAIVAAVSASCVIPYLAWNYLSTGHPLPVSGAVKAILTERYLDEAGIDQRLSLDFVRLVLSRYQDALRNFVTWRMADATTILGGRFVLGEDFRRGFYLLLGLAAMLPFLVGSPRAGLAALTGAFGRLRPLWFVVMFAAVNFAVCVYAYPQQLGYAMTQWWLIESELGVVVLAGALVGTAVDYAGARLVPGRVRVPLIAAGLALLIGLHGQRMVRFYWDGQFQVREWNPSWNDESLMAARWLAANAPGDAIVGSWNAGVLGYHAKQRVTNLDGLINNFDLLPYLRDRKLGEYILKENIAYLSDMAPSYTLYGIHDQLTLEEVYRHPNAMMRTDYVIYRVVGPSVPAGRGR